LLGAEANTKRDSLGETPFIDVAVCGVFGVQGAVNG
jgi:hypothetical protein